MTSEKTASTYSSDREAAEALAPQSSMHYSEPWRALAFALELRNFENERLRWEIERLNAHMREWAAAVATVQRLERELTAALGNPEQAHTLRDQIALARATLNSRALTLYAVVRASSEDS